MPTIRDDSAGSYGTWNNDDLSWLDYLTAKASDGGNALANLGRNLAQGFSPIGTSEQGNMALQVPPIVSGIAQSYSNLAGSPSHPGNAYDLTGVPELDAPIQQDMSNVLLSLYGGNAVSGLAKGRAAAANTALPKFERPPIPEGGVRAYRGAMKPDAIFNGPKDVMWASSSPMVADSYAGAWEGIDNWMPSMGAVAPLEMNFKNPMVLNAEGQWSHSIPFEGSTAHADKIAEAARQRGYDGLVLNNVRDGAGGTADYIRGTSYAALAPDTVYSPLTGETLFSDTGKPSILGSAMAGSSADLSSPAASAITQPPIRAYHGTKSEIDGLFRPSTNGLTGQGLYLGHDAVPSTSGFESMTGPEVASFYSKRGGDGYTGGERIYPVDVSANLVDEDKFNKLVESYVKSGNSRGEALSKAQSEMRNLGYEGLIGEGIMNVWSPNTVRSATTGETLFSDNRPSLLGSALATAGENYDLPEWLRF